MRINSGTESLSLIIIVWGKPGNKTTKHRREKKNEKEKRKKKKKKGGGGGGGGPHTQNNKKKRKEKKNLHKQTKTAKGEKNFKGKRKQQKKKKKKRRRRRKKEGIYVSVRCLWYFEFLRTSPVVCSAERGFAPADRQSLNGANHRFSALSALPPLRA